MFIDVADIYVCAGKGGDGHVSFHRAKYIPQGGPDGGDGGRGGDVIFVADPNMASLQDFRYKRKYKAEDGEPGGKNKMTGRSGDHLVIRVPVGTLLFDRDTNRLLADLSEADKEVIIAKGGAGGRGNARFATSVRQAPNFAKAGRIGMDFNLRIELKLLADVGLLGMPNVGKSTLLSVVSKARPKIADYHFTTLKPNLGICQVDDQNFVMADIPGLIPGAHKGAGLGGDFLRHVERTRLLVHLVDVAGSEGRDPVDDFDQINQELKLYDPVLSERPQIVVASKIDLATPEQIQHFRATMEGRGYSVYEICGPIHEGTEALMKAIAEKLSRLPRTVLSVPSYEDHKIYEAPMDLFTIRRDNERYVVEGEWASHLVASTNFDDAESLHYFQRMLRRHEVIEALERAGIQEGDTVVMDELEFEFIP
ncbi:MAG TPA: GTPase ObgE [Clostridiaceae bacterium]|nr:GTPase ObgE [Clostridiaceae bacterium]